MKILLLLLRLRVHEIFYYLTKNLINVALECDGSPLMSIDINQYFSRRRALIEVLRCAITDPERLSKNYVITYTYRTSLGLILEDREALVMKPINAKHRYEVKQLNITTYLKA